ncbi:MAG: ABC transporter permease, partial [Actinobacteria bacterium]|nr:ABC transporter permease [Actinomycetota bacterium]
MSDKEQVVDSTLRTTSTDGIPAESLTAADTAGQRPKRSGKDITNLLIRTIAPVLLAIVAGGLILLAMGKDPLFFYGNIINYGIMGRGWQQSLVMMTPLLLLAAGLIVVFRGKLWNLGYDAQYLLAAVLVIGFAPTLNAVLPWWLTLIVLTLLGIVVGAAWTIVPAILKARFETNEIITTLMMSFIGVGIANLLVRGPFQDPDVVVPQTQSIPLDSMLPYIPGTRIHVGLIVAVVVVLILHWV